ncbi:hypothetical protein GGI12_005575 [Dipsacomyces acuminosporus]|nr:hypothetical protein GGI12_005575 [Dipsacomyces acuminosporus]
MLEKEEEDLEIASAMLTGVPRISNRPASMAPHVFLNPNTLAYANQIKKTDRAYSYVRSATHPLLESISRCVGLREQRAALNPPRAQNRSWATRRPMTVSGEAGITNSAGGGAAGTQAEWWESLMPPPPSPSPNNAGRRTGAAGVLSSRVQTSELPQWVLRHDSAKCAVYGPDMYPVLDVTVGGAQEHTLVEPSCLHIRELRIKASKLKYARHQAQTAVKMQIVPPPRIDTSSTATMETWRGRRVPGLLNVELYTGSTLSVEGSGNRQVLRSGSDTIASSPDASWAARGNQIAPPYRRYGTVYGYKTADHSDARATTPSAVVSGVGAPASGSSSSGGVHAMAAATSGLIQGHSSLSMRRQTVTPTNRASTVGLWENDPRRSSYFDRLSIDDASRPQLSNSDIQSSPAGFIRRVISGLTGGASSYDIS